jgi:hypothetical protein
MKAPEHVQCLTSNCPEAWTVGVIYETNRKQVAYPNCLSIRGDDNNLYDVHFWTTGENSFKPLTKIEYDNLQTILFNQRPEPVDPYMGLKDGDTVTVINGRHPKGFSNGAIIEPISGWYSEYQIIGFREIDGLLYAIFKYSHVYLLVSELKKVEPESSIDVKSKINARITELKSECAVLVKEEFDLRNMGEYDRARNVSDMRINNYSTISALKWVLDQMK